MNAGTYCAWCGKPSAEGDHARCVQRLEWMDPPRHCPQCARRMVVQVSPAGWLAKCSRHGEIDPREWAGIQGAGAG
jgi:NADH pyrophosphatase NudC (nudix superfamily)